ncbi:MAG: beta-lactamase-like protein [Piptocephalis tieghemiana]|nr:MAG: beta-lactamase-like protein [Piptocephalis tieghemiana]
MTAPLRSDRPAPTSSLTKGKGRVVEIVILGSGTSGGVPNITCITSPTSPTCQVCHSSLTPEGRKNLRRNTSILIRYAPPEGDIRNILIDCGKTFYASALDWFPKYGIREIHAVILTHGHADAMLGLDDLRPFSHPMRGDPIPIYLSPHTLSVVRGAFPYIVDASLATGGGEVPSLQFHEITNPKKPFNVLGLEVQPLEVQHGSFSDGRPFPCLGFRFDDVVYLSDVSSIPPQVEKLIVSPRLYIIDCLKQTEYASHFGYEQAVKSVYAANPKDLALFTDLTHEWDHSTLFDKLARLSSPPCPVQPAYDGMHLVRQAPDDPWSLSS